MKMSYREELFTRYGSPSVEAEIKLFTWLNVPETCRSFDEVRRQDDKAALLIAECEHLITQLREYRQDLAKRYNDLATMPSKQSIELQRYKAYQGNVTFYIRHFTTYADGTKCETKTEKFTGKDRHKALKRFAELQKQHPGIEAKSNI